MYSGFTSKDFPTDLGKVTSSGAANEGIIRATEHENNPPHFYLTVIPTCFQRLISLLTLA